MTSSTVSSLNGRSRSRASAAATISASATSGVLRRRRPPASTPPTLTIGKRSRCTDFPSQSGAIQSRTTCRRSSVVEHRTFNPLWSQVRILPPAFVRSPGGRLHSEFDVAPCRARRRVNSRALQADRAFGRRLFAQAPADPRMRPTAHATRRLARACGAWERSSAAAPRTSARSPSAPWVTRTAATAGAIARRWIATRSGSSRTAPAPASSPPITTSSGLSTLTTAATALPTAAPASATARQAPRSPARTSSSRRATETGSPPRRARPARARDRLAAAVLEQAGDRDRAGDRLQAAAVAAAADPAVLHGRDVAELAGDSALPPIRTPAQNQPEADAGRQPHVDHVVHTPAGAKHVLAERADVRVVLDLHGQ